MGCEGSLPRPCQPPHLIPSPSHRFAAGPSLSRKRERGFRRPAFILPVGEADGEGDHPEDGGGALLSQNSPSTALRAVPLPIRFADREDARKTPLPFREREGPARRSRVRG
jgi:hypothetical protein